MSPNERDAEGWPGIDGPPPALDGAQEPRYVAQLAESVSRCLLWVDAEQAAKRMRPQRATAARRVAAWLPFFVSTNEHYQGGQFLICTSARRMAEKAGLSLPTTKAVLADLSDAGGPLVRVYRSRNGKTTNAYIFADRP